MRNTKCILIQGAMDVELAGYLKVLEDVESQTILGYPFYIGHYGAYTLILQKTFQGMTNAASATTCALLQRDFAIDLVINQGICGGHAKDVHRGDIIVADQVFNYSNFKFGPDSSTLFSGAQQIGIEMPITQFAPAGGQKEEFFYPDELLTKKILSHATGYKKATGYMGQIVTGTLASCDAWNDREDFIAFWNEEYQSLGEDMESVSVAQICTARDIPFLCIRTISNSLPCKEDYDEGTAGTLANFILYLLDASVF